MELKLFQKTLADWKEWQSKGKKEKEPIFWTPEKAKAEGFSSTEAFRSDFRRMRHKFEIKLEPKEVAASSMPRICVFDIETSPIKCYTFGLWNQNITIDKIITDTFMISWAGKMLNEAKVFSDVLTPEEAVNQEDFRIVKSLWDLLNSSDILIGHNLKQFDIKKFNTRCLLYNLPPISSVQIIDTLLVAKDNFSFSSNSLKYINQFLGIKTKVENDGFKLWAACMEGDKKALDTMLEYNVGDVFATEDLYYKILPFIKGHPNLSMFFESSERVCKKCMSKNLLKNGFYYTSASKFEAVRCADCGSVGRLKTNVLSSYKKKSLVTD